MKKRETNNKGITLLTLVVAVSIIIIMTGMLIVNAKNGIKMRKLNMMLNDIEVLDDKLNAYYAKYGALPYEVKYSNENINFEKGKNDNNNYYVIDLTAIDGITLNYGVDYTKITTEEESKNYDDVYIINEQSHHIYYARGIEMDGITYYTNDKSDEIELIGVYVALNGDTLVFGNTESNVKETVAAEAVYYGDISKIEFTETNIPWYDKRTEIIKVNFINKILPASTAYWFNGCINLTTFENISNLNTSKCKSFGYMFNEVSADKLDLSSFESSNVTKMEGMFKNCSNLTELNISNFNISNVKEYNSMFEGVPNTIQITVKNDETKTWIENKLGSGKGTVIVKAGT